MPEQDLSWFCSPRPAIVWIGRAGNKYPNSFELEPIQSPPQQAEGVNFKLRNEGRNIFKRYSFNPHYYKLDVSLKWIQN